jgi:hypothetical protein
LRYASFTKAGTPPSLRAGDTNGAEDTEDPDGPGALAHPATDSAASAATLKTENLFINFSFAAFAALKI